MTLLLLIGFALFLSSLLLGGTCTYLFLPRIIIQREEPLQPAELVPTTLTPLRTEEEEEEQATTFIPLVQVVAPPPPLVPITEEPGEDPPPPDQVARVQGRGAHNIKHGTGYLYRIEPPDGDIQCFDNCGATGRLIIPDEVEFKEGLTVICNDDQTYSIYYR